MQNFFKCAPLHWPYQKQEISQDIPDKKSAGRWVIGGGLDGGRVLGETDRDTLEAMPVNLNHGAVSYSGSTLNYERFVAGVLHAAGNETSEYLPGVEVLHGMIDSVEYMVLFVGHFMPRA